MNPAINSYMIKRIAVAFLIFSCLAGCRSSKKTSSSSSQSAKHADILDDETYKLTAVSEDDTYAFSEKNPVRVRGVGSGPKNERRFLNALLGPNGEVITYVRRGSCRSFKTLNGLAGRGLLDMYEVRYNGLEKPLIIYINMYNAGKLKAPKGFTYRTQP